MDRSPARLTDPNLNKFTSIQILRGVLEASWNQSKIHSLSLAMDCYVTLITDTERYIEQKRVTLLRPWVRRERDGKEKTIIENHKVIREIWTLIVYLTKLIIIITFLGVRTCLQLCLLKVSSLLHKQSLIIWVKWCGRGETRWSKYIHRSW